MKAEKRPFWVLLGPALLLAVIILLLFKIAPLTGSLIWLFGLGIATLLACWINYLAFQEIGAEEKDLQEVALKNKKEANDLRSVLDETHLLYREKVSKLEEAISHCEKEQGAKLKEKESALSQLQKGYEELFEQSHHYKNRAHSLQVSLEEALSELRDLSQIHYLEREQSIPKNLVKQHQQLREQFEEKSLVLDQTRRRLFAAEGFLLALKKERGLELLSLNEEQEILLSSIRELLQENEVLEQEVIALESLITASFKPTTSKKTGKKLQEMLELQFENVTSSKE